MTLISLRRLVETDHEWIFRACQDLEIQRFTLIPRPYTREHAIEFLRPQSGEYSVWVIQSGDDPVGVISIHKIDESTGTASVGYWIAKWGRGQRAASHALTLLCEYARNISKIHTLTAQIATTNVASRATAERSGFKNTIDIAETCPDGDTQVVALLYSKQINSVYKWPTGFMWGTGASSTQCEGAAPQSDWLAWERAGNAPKSENGNGFATRYAQDFEILASLGLTHHRLSIEWARIEPQQGVRDQNAIDHYRKILAAARESNIKIWVCLHHFSLPNWFAKLGGFLVEENRSKYWLEHVDFVAETFGDLVTGWQPVNETNYYATAAYLARGWPPGHNNVEEWLTVSEQMQLATAEAAVRLKQTGKLVVSIFGLSTLELLDAEPATQKFAERFYDANWNTGIKLFRDGVLQIGERKQVLRPDLAGSFDMIGFSYYSAHGVRNGKIVAYPETKKISPLGYAIWPDGLDLVLNRLKKELPNTPLLVAEFGVGTADDDERSEYLRAGLDVVHSAINRGIDIRGFFHWTAVDNYEWLHGYDLQFGIINRDRTTKPSSEVLRQEAKPS